MRIEHIGIENFKCFKSADLQLGKLTLLTGANSSGKSSILYSILGALQSGEFPFQFSPNGKYVNMGDFRAMSHNHLSDNTIKISFKIFSFFPMNLTTYWKEESQRRLPELERLELDANFFELKISKREKHEFTYNFYPEKMNVEEGEDPSILRHFKENEKASIQFTFKTIKDLFHKLLEEDVLTYMNLDFILKAISDHRLNFISSFRFHPERTYYETTKTNLKVGKFGEDYINQIILWETQKAGEYQELLKIMKSLSLLTEIKSKRMDGGRFDLEVKVNEKSRSASLNDVGFGISQFLPIIVSDLQLGDDSTLLVAQPEIHLHPSVQAEFGSYMVDRIKESNKNYIVETHSEYLLNRIRLAIVKGEIPKEDVSIYYFQNDGNESITHKLEFTQDGQILNAPEDFFKTYMIDVMNIALNASSNGE